MVLTMADMMDGKDMVVDNPFDDIEETPAKEQGANEDLRRPGGMRRSAGTPKQYETGDGGEIDAGVKEPVRERVCLESADCRRWPAVSVAQHVMPLKQLMQHNPVEEASETKSEQDTCGDGRRR